MTAGAMRLLLVEDNAGDVRLLREALAGATSQQFEIAHVTRLGDALTRLASESFDVVLLDLSLPDSHGFQTFTRAHAEAPGTPIVVLSGMQDEEIAVQAVQAGAQDYLTKAHMETYSLVRALRYAIERLRREQAEVLRRTQTVHLWRSLFRTLGRGASPVLYLAGVDAGAETFEFIQQTWKPRDERGFVEAARDYFRSTGLCDIEAFAIDRAASRVNVRVRESFFEKLSRDPPSTAPVCHFLRGVLAGMAIRILGVAELVADEVSCRAQGAGACVFVVHPLFA